MTDEGEPELLSPEERTEASVDGPATRQRARPPVAAHDLRHESELTDNIIGSSVDGILAFDRECRYTVWNPAMERISGVPASETLGRSAFEVFPFLEEIGEDWYFYEALAGRYAVARDRRYTVPSTGHTGFFEGHYTPLRNTHGEVIGGLAIIRDTTDLKQTQAQLVQAGKLAAMGQLGAGIAHELNQPLTGIRLLLDIIRQDKQRPVQQCIPDLDMISEQIMRMARIVNNLRGFARSGGFEPRATPATAPLDDALMLMAEQLRLAGVVVEQRFETDLPPIRADASQLQQVFLNLLTNALQALEHHDGTRRIGLGARARSDAVELTVEDTGPGIPADARDRIFDPFFTTKEPGSGTGLGLSLCYGIVRDHGGEIRAEAPADGGARFVVEVPVAEGVPTGARTNQLPRARIRKGCVLVVDDEPVLRDSIVRTLQDLGYECESAGDAATALSRVSQETFDAALVDLKMPGVGGAELCARLRAQHPRLALVVMSGFVTQAVDGELERLGVKTVLAKPFSPSSLDAALHGAIGAAPD